VKSGVVLLMVSFFLALLQACTQDNGILKPACTVSEVDLDEKWWYPQDNITEPAIYFRSNGLINIEGQSDSVSFKLSNCNKIVVTTLANGSSEMWVIKRITNEELSIQYPAKGMVTYDRTR